jgi:transcriptional regulator with XRE-family HTH domain
MYFTAANLPTPETSFRLFLQSELARRCSRNPQYSLRSFAAQLAVDASTLSQWLRHRRPLTSRVIETIGAQLGVPEDRIRAYIDYEMRQPPVDGPSPSQLTAETIAAIEDWRSLAVLELSHLENFRADSRWIAAMLDISVDAVNLALHRLVSLDLLRMEQTQWVDTVPSAAVSLDALPDAFAATLHRQTGDWRERSVREVPAQDRELSSTTVAIRSDALPRAIDLLTKCRRQLLELLQDGTADDVYQLDLALFPVTTAKRRQPTPESESNQ